MPPKGKSKDWKATNMRLGSNPLELQKLDKNGQLNPHMNVSPILCLDLILTNFKADG